MIKIVSVIGCGWLGTQLSLDLFASGISVLAASRSTHHYELNQFGVEYHSFNAEKDCLPQRLIEESDLSILTLPPNKFSSPEAYITALQSIARQLKSRVIYTSSIGIYPQKEGTITEDYVFDEADKEALLYRAEEALRKILKDRLTILRLGGLIGGERHPVKYIAGKSMPTNGMEPVHLIHRKDIIRFVDYLIHHPDLLNDTYNLIYPIDLSKKLYYERIASRSGYPIPKYSNNIGIQRVIRTVRMQNCSDFNLLYNPIDFTFENSKLN